MPVTGLNSAILFGQYRLSVDHYGGQFTTENNMIDVQPTLENDWSTQLIGSRKRTGQSDSYASGALLQALKSAWNSRSEMPVAIYRKGAGLGWCDVNKARLQNSPDTFELDTPETRANIFGFSEVYKPFAGAVYDYSYEDGAGGITGVKDGPWYQTGALAAGEIYRATLFNPHYPTPDITSATILLRSASDALGTGATTEVTFSGLTSTASYEIATVTGPKTNAFWQLSCSAFTGNNLYPVLLLTRID